MVWSIMIVDLIEGEVFNPSYDRIGDNLLTVKYYIAQFLFCSVQRFDYKITVIKIILV